MKTVALWLALTAWVTLWFGILVGVGAPEAQEAQEAQEAAPQPFPRAEFEMLKHQQDALFQMAQLKGWKLTPQVVWGEGKGDKDESHD